MRKASLLSLMFAVTLAPVAVDRALAAEPKCDSDADACVKWMISNFENRGWIGIELDYSERKTPTITRVLGSSPAQEAGLTAGDVLLAVDGVGYDSATKEELAKARDSMTPGREIVVKIERGGETLELPLTLGRIPQSVLAQWIGSHLLQGHAHQYADATTD